MDKVMDRETAEHFYRWLESNVHESEQHGVEQLIHALLRDDPSLVELGWSKLREIGESTSLVSLGHAPNDSRCDCERKGCHAGDCSREAFFRVLIFGHPQNLCAYCYREARKQKKS